MKQEVAQLPYRLSIASRIIAAVGGGYCLSTFTTLIFAYILPGSRAPALLMGMILSFLVYAIVIIWVFSTRTATKAWVGLVAMIVPLGLVYTFISQGVSI